ncbi:hypothetical protein [Odoribacter laneus]|uniref:hypothetical protein n=1 Tax=Odoribacter laneus TaxID=626933 RepID=UPI00399BEC3E
MKKMGLLTLIYLLLLYACQTELLEYEGGDVQIRIEKGEEWLHDFPVVLGIKKKNPPQLAIWLEDTAGNYFSTVYVTHKIATQSWRIAGGNRRKEALPHWCYTRGVKYDDGLYLPTKSCPLADGISGATPQGDFEVKLRPKDLSKRFVVKIELNHSTDFNDFYPKSAREGETNYSGGKEGSGQPAIVYAAFVDLLSGEKVFEAFLVGHSSPDGSSGKIDKDLSGLTTALHIIKRITVNIR